MSSLLYNIKQGFLQIFRNRGMSLASIFSILAMLLILGLFFVITVNINLFTEVVRTTIRWKYSFWMTPRKRMPRS